MKTRLAALFETYPPLGWISSILSIVTGWSAWFVQHVDEFTKIFGLFAVIFGVIVGYYTMRIKRLEFQRKSAPRQPSHSGYPPQRLD